MCINFVNIASTVLMEHCEQVRSAITATKCPDQYVGLISDNLGQDNFHLRLNLPENLDQCEGVQRVILILESPHKDEFDLENHALGPANGATGRHIRNRDYFNAVFGEQIHDYGLILMNAIRYQCSLGIPPECVRDKIFRAVWQNGGKANFTERIRAYYSVERGDLIANCCTASNEGGRKLRDLVQDALLELVPTIPPGTIIRRTHPSSWPRSPNNCNNIDWEYRSLL